MGGCLSELSQSPAVIPVKTGIQRRQGRDGYESEERTWKDGQPEKSVPFVHQLPLDRHEAGDIVQD